MTGINALFFFAGLLLFISVLASTVSARLGLPLLLLFLVIGMLAGEDGPGGVDFDDFFIASMIGQLALAVILLDGGLRTRVSSFRVALRPAAVLATWGVFGTALSLGVFATWLLEVDWRLGLLLASIVGSTDAAAVFAVLRNSGVQLNERVKATLEIESGANDPMAILLVTALVEMLLHPEKASAEQFGLMLVMQLGLGAFAGYAGGRALAALMARLSLAEGLYALLILSGGLVIFGATNLFGGSGFLAVYLAGLMVGHQQRNRKPVSLPHDRLGRQGLQRSLQACVDRGLMPGGQRVLTAQPIGQMRGKSGKVTPHRRNCFAQGRLNAVRSQQAGAGHARQNPRPRGAGRFWRTVGSARFG